MAGRLEDWPSTSAVPCSFSRCAFAGHCMHNHALTPEVTCLFGCQVEYVGVCRRASDAAERRVALRYAMHWHLPGPQLATEWSWRVADKCSLVLAATSAAYAPDHVRPAQHYDLFVDARGTLQLDAAGPQLALRGPGLLSHTCTLSSARHPLPTSLTRPLETHPQGVRPVHASKRRLTVSRPSPALLALGPDAHVPLPTNQGGKRKGHGGVGGGRREVRQNDVARES